MLSKRTREAKRYSINFHNDLVGLIKTLTKKYAIKLSKDNNSGGKDIRGCFDPNKAERILKAKNIIMRTSTNLILKLMRFTTNCLTKYNNIAKVIKCVVVTVMV
jgi:hypothetical protein